MKWTTKEEGDIEIGDMQDSHLLNSIWLVRTKIDSLRHLEFLMDGEKDAHTQIKNWILDKQTFKLDPFHEIILPEKHHPYPDDEFSLRFFTLCMEAKKRGLKYELSDKHRMQRCTQSTYPYGRGYSAGYRSKNF